MSRLGEAARRFATSELCPQVVGTPASVAEQLTGLFASRACDGFIVTPTVFRGTWEPVVRPVVPSCSGAGCSAPSTQAAPCARS
jgi:alkanesulfonate monooxygenase SsuD/methylene tetrahydromethanopterin reductase-like flavin-dependent oxidoreductase (luciferase family)